MGALAWIFQVGGNQALELNNLVTFVLEVSLDRVRWDLSFGDSWLGIPHLNFRLGAFAWEPYLDNCRLGAFAWLFFLEVFRLGVPALESSIASFRLITSAQEPWHDNFHAEIFRHELSLGNARFVTFTSHRPFWELHLRY